MDLLDLKVYWTLSLLFLACGVPAQAFLFTRIGGYYPVDNVKADIERNKHETQVKTKTAIAEPTLSPELVSIADSVLGITFDFEKDDNNNDKTMSTTVSQAVTTQPATISGDTPETTSVSTTSVPTSSLSQELTSGQTQPPVNPSEGREGKTKLISENAEAKPTPSGRCSDEIQKENKTGEAPQASPPSSDQQSAAATSQQPGNTEPSTTQPTPTTTSTTPTPTTKSTSTTSWTTSKTSIFLSNQGYGPDDKVLGPEEEKKEQDKKSYNVLLTMERFLTKKRKKLKEDIDEKKDDPYDLDVYDLKRRRRASKHSYGLDDSLNQEGMDDNENDENLNSDDGPMEGIRDDELEIEDNFSDNGENDDVASTRSEEEGEDSVTEEEVEDIDSFNVEDENDNTDNTEETEDAESITNDNSYEADDSSLDDFNDEDNEDINESSPVDDIDDQTGDWDLSSSEEETPTVVRESETEEIVESKDGHMAAKVTDTDRKDNERETSVESERNTASDDQEAQSEDSGGSVWNKMKDMETKSTGREEKHPQKELVTDQSESDTETARDTLDSLLGKNRGKRSHKTRPDKELNKHPRKSNPAESTEMKKKKKRETEEFGTTDEKTNTPEVQEGDAGKYDGLSGPIRTKEMLENLGQRLPTGPQGSLPWSEPRLHSNCWYHAMTSYKHKFSPSCKADGTYSPKQCYRQRCWCVSPEGRPYEKTPRERFYFNIRALMLRCTQNEL